MDRTAILCKTLWMTCAEEPSACAQAREAWGFLTGFRVQTRVLPGKTISHPVEREETETVHTPRRKKSGMSQIFIVSLSSCDQCLGL